ncbi:MAG: hypothetical protein A3C06_03440 [Candidatus Taylorbacteria bacterium RIFCSPHIGHO2_02_FULL_46_13]|uniref:Uncharacterized protein n=1 Tax=Candidatus Taylorbacteria bacterium RIFCSPHIGHO2_02_FULL_46_13 TaxID=1802312 RepID=A0A1G2MW81_9BACT|nr:MAG: hypothetical protein A3C06_03440 [Candidatus Taylorbacteria bacterium RIFCSPHIGHO2_02_FULL_46_13]
MKSGKKKPLAGAERTPVALLSQNANASSGPKGSLAPTEVLRAVAPLCSIFIITKYDIKIKLFFVAP